MSNLSPVAPSLAQTNEAVNDKNWQQRALVAAKEAGLASRLLQRLLVTSTETSPNISPLPTVSPASLTVSEDVVYNVESVERTAKYVTINGWAFLRTSQDCRRTRISCLICAGENWFCVPVTTIHRPDVAAVFPADDAGEANRAFSGFVIRFECESFRSAPFNGRLLMQEGNSGTVISGSFDLPVHL